MGHIIGTTALILLMSAMALFVLFFILAMVDDLFFDNKIQAWWDNRSNTKKQAKIRKAVKNGTRKSDAYIQGYKDMAHKLGNKCGTYLSDYSDFLIPEDSSSVKVVVRELREMAKYPRVIREFDPALGRKNNAYVRSTDNQDWEDYYKGGMQFLSDLDDFQAKVLEEERLVEVRLKGVEQYDRQHMEAKKQLDMLRDKTFNRVIEAKEFDTQMTELGGTQKKRRFLTRN